eukprot:4168744-Prymnesium_polylepis.1
MRPRAQNTKKTHPAATPGPGTEHNMWSNFTASRIRRVRPVIADASYSTHAPPHQRPTSIDVGSSWLSRQSDASSSGAPMRVSISNTCGIARFEPAYVPPH